MTTVYPYAIVKTKESGSVFTGDRELSTAIIEVFKTDKYNIFSPSRDYLIKNASVTKNNDELEVIGDEIFYMTAGIIDKMRFGKKFELFYEFDDKNKQWTVEDVQEQIKIHTHGKLKLDDSQIKLGYSSVVDFFKRKKIFYIDCTVEVICAFQHTYPQYVKKDKKGYYLEGYYKTSLTKPFKFKTNNYRIAEF
jgi:hypothetical protein